jgi:hypothetical protein
MNPEEGQSLEQPLRWGLKAPNSPKILLPLMMAFVLTVQSSQSTEYTFDSPGNTVYAQVNHPKRVSLFSLELHHYCYFYSDYLQTCHPNNPVYPNDIHHWEEMKPATKAASYMQDHSIVCCSRPVGMFIPTLFSTVLELLHASVGLVPSA